VTRVVCMHGIGAQYSGEHQLASRWVPALLDGLRRATGDRLQLAATEISVAFYGDLFRPAGRVLALGPPPFAAADVTDPLECELLSAWWAEAARVDPHVVAPERRTLARTPAFVQSALAALSAASFFGDVALRAMVADLRQVRRYLLDDETRAHVQDRLAACITVDTRVVVAHSLGSVAAYEALAAHPEWPPLTLVTLGSPLGICNLVFDRLRPTPVDGRGAWPEAISAWTNVADAGDVVALVKDLRPRFGDRLRSFVVDNGAHAHDVRPYLSAVETGRAIAEGLEQPG
jgi:pimeloyl-ACP methyl ester carboxylesterase